MKKLAVIIFLSSILLMLLGAVVVMSASSAFSEAKFDSAFHLFGSHLFKVFLGILLMVVFAIIPYEKYKKLSKPAIFLLVGLLVYVLIFGSNLKGAGRWISFGLFSFQPAEAAKLILIMHLAVLIDRKGEQIKEYRNGFLYLFIWVAMVSVLIIVQPNLSNGILLVAISLFILYTGGARLKHIVVSSLASFLAAGSLVMLFPHSRGRILAFVKSISEGGELNFQVNQAVLSLGSGGIFGVGLGNSFQSKFFLPEAYGDFIFAILGEEIGIVGSLLVITLFIVIFFCGILIAKKTRDVFGQMLAFGITVTVTTYFIVNVGVTTGLLPTTGIPLPFISYGGTSLLFLCISIGILLNIAIAQSKLEMSPDPVTPAKEILAGVRV